MKTPDFVQSLSIIANIGVIVGIVFLAVEIRESNTQATIATVQDVVDQNSGWREFIAADGELAEIYAKGMADLVQLSPREKTQFDFMMRSRLQRLAGALIARDAELLHTTSIPDLEDRVVEGEVLYFLDQPGFRQWWSTLDRRGISEVILDLVDAMEDLRAGG